MSFPGSRREDYMTWKDAYYELSETYAVLKEKYNNQIEKNSDLQNRVKHLEEKLFGLLEQKYK